jgi:hypothetical protein
MQMANKQQAISQYHSRLFFALAECIRDQVISGNKKRDGKEF